MIKKAISLSILFMLFLSPLAALEDTYGPVDSETRIVLAYEETRFKNRLMDQLVDLLNDGEVFIQVVDHKDGGLDGISASDYDVIYITNSGATAKVRPWVSAWLRANGNDPDNVIVHTTQTTRWTPRVQVDSVTSASYGNSNDIEELAEELSDQIKAKL
jgi:hypothetical protein